MKQNSILYKLLLFILVFAMLFQDLPLQLVLGTIARSPVVFVAPVVFIVIILNEELVVFDKLTKYFLRYWLITMASAIIILCVTIFFVTKFNMYSYVEFMPAKLIKAGTYNLTYVFVAYSLYNLSQRVSLEYICQLLSAILFFLIAYGIIQTFTSIEIPFIHSLSSIGDNRISLTTSEPSVGSFMFANFAVMVIALRIYLKKNSLATLIIGALSVFILFNVGSKGGLIFLPIAAVWALRKKINFKIGLVALIFLAPFIYFVITIVLPQVAIDIDDFNSFSTRSTTWLASMQSLFLYPFGEGYGTYLIYYPPLLLPMNTHLIALTGLPLLSKELTDMVATGINLPAKAGIPTEITYNGFFAVIFFYYLFRYYASLVKSLADDIPKLIFSFLGTFLFLEFLFNVVLETSYSYVIAFMVMQKITGLRQNNLNKTLSPV
jgi:hypothetical protein